MRSQTCRPMMDTYIMTSDTMEAVPLVAAQREGRKSSNQTKHQIGNLTKLLLSRNTLTERIHLEIQRQRATADTINCTNLFLISLCRGETVQANCESQSSEIVVFLFKRDTKVWYLEIHDSLQNNYWLYPSFGFTYDTFHLQAILYIVLWCDGSDIAKLVVWRQSGQ